MAGEEFWIPGAGDVKLSSSQIQAIDRAVQSAGVGNLPASNVGKAGAAATQGGALVQAGFPSPEEILNMIRGYLGDVSGGRVGGVLPPAGAQGEKSLVTGTVPVGGIAQGAAALGLPAALVTALTVGGGIYDLMTPGGLLPDVIDLPWNSPPYGIGTAKTWMSGNQKFYMLDDGSICTRKKNGVWRRWRPYRSVVLGKRPTVSQIKRAANKMNTLAKSLSTVLRITKPKTRRRK